MNKIEWIGVLVIAALGTLLHYTYAASGEVLLVGFFSAMNESVWEHLKLTFWPGVVWTLFLAKGLGWTSHQNFWFTRVSAVTISTLLIVIFFYSYTAILGGNFLVLDLSIFVVSITIGQRLAVKLYSIRSVPPGLTNLALVVILLEALSFIVFSVWPPSLGIFQPSIH
jgi:hypothetical protein